MVGRPTPRGLQPKSVACLLEKDALFEPKTENAIGMAAHGLRK